MTIASAITAAQGKVSDCYTAISNKGGTLPATQNLSNMPTAINSIPSGGGGSSKYGCTIDNLLGDVDANGVLQLPADTSGDIVFTGVKDIKNGALMYKFYNNKSSVSVSFPDLESLSYEESLYYGFSNSNINGVSFPKLASVSGNGALNYSFCYSKVSSVSFPELLSITGTSSMRNMFSYDSYLTSASFPKLETVTGYTCMGQMFSNTKITTLSFPKLDNINGGYVMLAILQSCTTITDVYFNSLKTTSFGTNTNQFVNMMSSTGSQVTHTLHFPSNLSSTISGLSGYPLFGGTSGYVVLAFDLPATS